MSLFFETDALADSTWTGVQLMIWTTAEPGVLIICACLPTIWPLFVRFVLGPLQLRSKTQAGSNPSNNPESKTPAPWTAGRNRARVTTSGEDFIPLRNVDDQWVECEAPGSAGKGSPGARPDNGISVKHDVTWTTTSVLP